MSEWFHSLRERLKMTIGFASVLALVCFLASASDKNSFSMFFLFLSLSGGAFLLFCYLDGTVERKISLLLSLIFFVLFIIWCRMEFNPSAFPKLRDWLLWNRCDTQEEKLDYLEHQRWDHDRAVAVYTSMGREQAMKELKATVRWGMDRAIPFSGKGFPDAEKYRRYGRLIIALKESDFLTHANAAELADQYFVEYPFSALKEDSEDWDVVLAMLGFCSDDCLRHTLLQDRKADLPAGITDYILNLLKV